MCVLGHRTLLQSDPQSAISIKYGCKENLLMSLLQTILGLGLWAQSRQVRKAARVLSGPHRAWLHPGQANRTIPSLFKLIWTSSSRPDQFVLFSSPAATLTQRHLVSDGSDAADFSEPTLTRLNI